MFAFIQSLTNNGVLYTTLVRLSSQIQMVIINTMLTVDDANREDSAISEMSISHLGRIAPII